MDTEKIESSCLHPRSFTHTHHSVICLYIGKERQETSQENVIQERKWYRTLVRIRTVMFILILGLDVCEVVLVHEGQEGWSSQ
jgi:hypothetical protein